MANLREDLYGRTRIYTDVEEIDESNIKDVLEDALSKQEENFTDVEYLWNFYLGDQPINIRTKTYNADINNKIVVNHAAEIVNFMTGYLLSAPIQYIDAAANDFEEGVDTSDLVSLTKWCKLEGKDTSDIEVAQYMSACGTGYRMALPKESFEEGESPFFITTLDPENTFVVYSSYPGHAPKIGVIRVPINDDETLYYAYTKDHLFILDKDFNDASNDTYRSGPHAMEMVPIIEYPANLEMMSDFEKVITLLNAINTNESNRLDAVEQFIQAILVLENMQVEAIDGQEQADAEALFMQAVKQVGALQVPKDGKAYYLSQELNQSQAQVLMDDMYDKVLKICGMPSRAMQSAATPDTGSAAILNNGWSETESRAVNREKYFKKAERQFLNLLIKICNSSGGTNILPGDVDIRFPRRNYTNDSSNVNNLITMLNNEWVRPEFAYEHSQTCADPHKEWILAKKWHEENEQNQVEDLTHANDEEPDDTLVPAIENETATPILGNNG